jgi:glycosyltransferase involved in cell wall biosynthesis
MMTADAVGGVWNYALDLARSHAAQEIETILAILGPSPSAAQRMAAGSIPGIRIVDTGLPLEWTASDLTEIAEAAHLLTELATATRPDIVHLNTPALACADYPVPVLVMAHSCLATWWNAMRREAVPRDFLWRIEATWVGLERADAIIAASCSFRDSLHEVYGTHLPISVVYNGRPPEAGLSVKQPGLVLTAGRLWDESKNIALLDQIAPRLDFPIIAAGSLCGPNGATADFRHLVLLGNLTDAQIAPMYAAAEIFVSPARYEPFGLAVLQAAQSGAALILSSIPTFRELWNGAALFADPEDPGAWQATLQALAEAPEDAAKLGAAARERARRYTLDAMVSNTTEVYRRVLAANDAFPSPVSVAW